MTNLGHENLSKWALQKIIGMESFPTLLHKIGNLTSGPAIWSAICLALPKKSIQHKLKFLNLVCHKQLSINLLHGAMLFGLNL